MSPTINPLLVSWQELIEVRFEWNVGLQELGVPLYLSAYFEIQQETVNGDAEGSQSSVHGHTVHDWLPWERSVRPIADKKGEENPIKLQWGISNFDETHGSV